MKGAIHAFARAVFWGSLAGGGPCTLKPPGWSEPEVIWLAIMPLVIAIVVVVLAALLIGLPLTAWLARNRDEDVVAYAIPGLGFGALLPIALIVAPSGDWAMGAVLALPGALAGAVTGASWGRWRERVADRPAQHEPPPAPR